MKNKIAHLTKEDMVDIAKTFAGIFHIVISMAFLIGFMLGIKLKS